MNRGNYKFNSQTAVGIPKNIAQPDAGLNRATRDLATEFSLIGREIRLNPQVRFRVVLEGRSQLLDPLVYEHAYRIGCEAVLNAFRHSQASRIDLHLAYTPTGLSLIVRDNGQGMSADSMYMGGNGLSWMKALAERIGATLKLLSRTRAGTEVLLSIPGPIAFSSMTKAHWQAAIA